MRKTTVPTLVSLALISSVVAANSSAAEILSINPISIHSQVGDSATPMEWKSESIPVKEGKPGVYSTQMVGSLATPGIYVTRVKLAPNARNAPHYHPDGRLTTVIAGTIYFGRGEVADMRNAHVFHQGDAYYTPPKIPHWLVAGPEGAVYEEVGFGPSAAMPAVSHGK